MAPKLGRIDAGLAELDAANFAWLRHLCASRGTYRTKDTETWTARRTRDVERCRCRGLKSGSIGDDGCLIPQRELARGLACENFVALHSPAIAN